MVASHGRNCVRSPLARKRVIAVLYVFLMVALKRLIRAIPIRRRAAVCPIPRRRNASVSLPPPPPVTPCFTPLPLPLPLWDQPTLYYQRVWQWKDEYGGKITRQIRKLGSSVDWSREAFTMDANLSRA